MTVLSLPNLKISTLQAAYQQGLTPERLLEALLPLFNQDEHHIWISRLSEDALMGYAKRLSSLSSQQRQQLPLYGVPFAIKDNIDLVDLPTTAACPAFAYQPQQSAFVVQRLIDAGAIPLGKTNLDQFATGLNGTRSPYGACKNSIDPRYISGGSSAGSAVAVALGLVSFSLGTDTAGSGRVPAMFNRLVGVKPSYGLLSNRGVVPACRTLDCVSIFTQDCVDAETVLTVSAAYDQAEPFSRSITPLPFKKLTKLGIPRATQLEFFGQDEYAALFKQAISQFKAQGVQVVEFDFSDFLEAAQALYKGSWVAERYHVVAPLMNTQPDAVLPVIRSIVSAASTMSAKQAFTDRYQMAALKRRTDEILAQVDCLMTPTAGAIYTLEEMLANPIELNSRLGYYTNFMNLLDYAALAIPAGTRADGLPFGVTLFSHAGSDQNLLKWAQQHPLEA